MMNAEGTMRSRSVRHLRPASPSPQALRPTRTMLATAQRAGWVVALLALPLARVAVGAEAAPRVDFLGGEHDLALSAGTAERLAEPGALDRILGSSFDRIEIFRGDRLMRVLAVARVEGSAGNLAAQQASVAAALAVATPAADVAGDTEPQGPSMTLAEALAVARDPNALPHERQRALAELAASGESAAVDALREVAAGEVGTEAGRMALLGLGGFAGGEAAPAAAAALSELASIGSADPVDLFRAQAAYDMTPLIADFQATIDTKIRYQKVQAAANSAGAPGLTDFYIAALGDPSSDIVRTAAMDMGRLIDRLDAGRVQQALEQVVGDHRSRSAQEGARIGLRYASAGGPIRDLGPDFDPASHGGTPDSGSGGRGTTPRQPASGSVTVFGD